MHSQDKTPQTVSNLSPQTGWQWDIGAVAEREEIQQQSGKDLRDQARKEKFLFPLLLSFWKLLQSLKKEIRKNSLQQRAWQGL